MFFSKKFEELERKVLVFERLTNISLDQWVDEFVKFEHEYHSRKQQIGELQNQLDLLKANIKLFEDKIELTKLTTRAECIKEYYIDLIQYIERTNIENRGFLENIIKEIATSEPSKIEIIK